VIVAITSIEAMIVAALNATISMIRMMKVFLLRRKNIRTVPAYLLLKEAEVAALHNK
jgi:hypothetical protein